MLLAAPSAGPESQSKVAQLADFNPTWLTTTTRLVDMLSCFHLHLTFLYSEKGLKAAPAEAVVPVISTLVKRLDNLFFIEEPKNISVTESKWPHQRVPVHPQH